MLILPISGGFFSTLQNEKKYVICNIRGRQPTAREAHGLYAANMQFLCGPPGAQRKKNNMNNIMRTFARVVDAACEQKSQLFFTPQW